ncbi:putative Mg2+ transporter-e family [Paratrimastix pyriformis]|uniref:Mg2+ transporter-e family n=1 Tax=Paratrimastix pyriformis TaxID=342808 RepID=A0ABQ8UVF5_9EUKA|nr:putative Mg2+ transporter-e family [Paratrimastix pyriformis]
MKRQDIPQESDTESGSEEKGKSEMTRRSFSSEVVHLWLKRSSFLVALLLFQSLSGVIMKKFEGLLASHVEITLFLTMLVGAGGNTSNQSSVQVITGLATGKIKLTMTSFRNLFRKELSAGLLSALTLAAVGGIRVWISYGLSPEDKGSLATAALVLIISGSLFTIALVSTALGVLLPLTLAWLHFDPELAGPALQVMCDIVGVLVTCIVAQAVLA